MPKRKLCGIITFSAALDVVKLGIKKKRASARRERSVSVTEDKLAASLNGQALAYLGDAAIEMLVRRYLIRLGAGDSGTLSKLALDFVRATAQSAGMDKILPLLTEEEEYIFKRGRNAHGISIPKSASAAEYRRATGMEALFGYLDLCRRNERAEELFRIAYADVIARYENRTTEDRRGQ